MNTLIARVQAALTQAGLDQFALTADADLRLYGMDSLMMVLTVSELERAFNISITPAAFAESHFHSIGSIAALVMRLQASDGRP
jgi:acyl carrier protein